MCNQNVLGLFPRDKYNINNYLAVISKETFLLNLLDCLGRCSICLDTSSGVFVINLLTVKHMKMISMQLFVFNPLYFNQAFPHIQSEKELVLFLLLSCLKKIYLHLQPSVFSRRITLWLETTIWLWADTMSLQRRCVGWSLPCVLLLSAGFSENEPSRSNKEIWKKSTSFEFSVLSYSSRPHLRPIAALSYRLLPLFEIFFPSHTHFRLSYAFETEKAKVDLHFDFVLWITCTLLSGGL